MTAFLTHDQQNERLLRGSGCMACESRLDAHEQVEFTDWQWRPLADCVELVVPFKRHIYQYVAKQFAHLAARR